MRSYPYFSIWFSGVKHIHIVETIQKFFTLQNGTSTPMKQQLFMSLSHQTLVTTMLLPDFESLTTLNTSRQYSKRNPIVICLFVNGLFHLALLLTVYPWYSV